MCVGVGVGKDIGMWHTIEWLSVIVRAVFVFVLGGVGLVCSVVAIVVVDVALWL